MCSGETKFQVKRRTVAILHDKIKFLSYLREIKITNAGITIALPNIYSTGLILLKDATKELKINVKKSHQISKSFTILDASI
jgi:hypothetical protein